jgi:hypothetical protein
MLIFLKHPASRNFTRITPIVTICEDFPLYFKPS